MELMLMVSDYRILGCHRHLVGTMGENNLCSKKLQDHETSSHAGLNSRPAMIVSALHRLFVHCKVFNLCDYILCYNLAYCWGRL